MFRISITSSMLSSGPSIPQSVVASQMPSRYSIHMVSRHSGNSAIRPHQMHGSISHQVSKTVCYQAALPKVPLEYHKCIQCSTRFSCLERLLRHSQRANCSMASCKHCEQVFESKNKLHQHIRNRDCQQFVSALKNMAPHKRSLLVLTAAGSTPSEAVAKASNPSTPPPTYRVVSRPPPIYGTTTSKTI